MPVQPKLQTDDPRELATNAYKAIVFATLGLNWLAAVTAFMQFFGGFGWLLPSLFAVSLPVLLVGIVVLPERHWLWLWLLAFALATATLSALLAPVLAHWRTAVTFFGVIAGACLCYCGPQIMGTLGTYLEADPNLPKGVSAPSLDCRPMYAIGAAYFLILRFVPARSVTLATVLTLALASGVIVTYTDTFAGVKAAATLFRNAVHVFSDSRDGTTPGTWRPELIRPVRLTILMTLLLAVSLTFSVSTSFGSCYDSWGKVTKSAETPFYWFTAPIAGFLTFDPMYPLWVVQALWATLTMPVLMLFTLMLPVLTQINTWLEQARLEATDDPRSELEKLLDKGGSE